MPIRLGTVAPIGFDDFASPQWLACFRRLGCTVVQAYRNPQAKLSLRQMQDYMAAGGMPCDSLHGIFGEEYDPSACQEPHRLFAMDTFRREGELAVQLGGPLVVVHCATIRRDGIGPEERRLRLAQLRKSMADLGSFGQQIGVTYAFENLPRYHAIGYDVGELAGLLRDVAAPRAGLCLDTGHALMAGDPVAAVRAAADQIAYVHLNDNNGASDDHEMPTYAALDSDGLCDALHDVRYQGTMMLEVFHPLDRLKQLVDGDCAQRLAALIARANGQAG